MSGLIKRIGWGDRSTPWFGRAASGAQPAPQPVDVANVTYRLWTSDGTDSGNRWPANRIYIAAETQAQADALIKKLGPALKANPATSGITLRKMGEGDDGIEVHVFGITSFSEDEIPRDAMAFVDVGVEAGVLHKRSVYANMHAGRLLEAVSIATERFDDAPKPAGREPRGN